MSFVPKTKEELFLLGNLHIVSRAIHVFARYPLADLLIDGSKTAKEMSAPFNFDPVALSKVLRVLCAFDILTEENEKFSLGSLGKYFCHSHAETLKDLLFWDESRWSPLGKLEETLKTGSESFSKIFGMDYFGYISKQPGLQKTFDAHMKAVSLDEDKKLAKILPMKRSSTFVDIGGGHGGLVEEILENHPTLSAYLFDLPETINAVSYSLQSKYSNRITCVRGSFFEPIPLSCDAVLLKRILHDWTDEQCLQILRQVKGVIQPKGQIFIVETVLQGEKDSPLIRMFDLFLLNVFGGRERSLADYKKLISQADLNYSHLIETDTTMSIIVISNEE